MIVKSALLLISVLALCACATAAQREAHHIVTSIQALQTPTEACVKKVAADPQFLPLTAHFPIGNGSQPTIEQMADTTTPTQQDIHLLSLFYAEGEACFRNLTDRIAQVAPTLSQVIFDLIAKSDTNALALAKGEENWGQFVTRKRQIQEEQRQKFAEALAQLGHELEAEDQEERERRQQAFDASAQYFQNQQLINSLTQPRVTNCTHFGISTTCTSY